MKIFKIVGKEAAQRLAVALIKELVCFRCRPYTDDKCMFEMETGVSITDEKDIKRMLEYLERCVKECETKSSTRLRQYPRPLLYP